jgi:hypothetical protein
MWVYTHEGALWVLVTGYQCTALVGSAVRNHDSGSSFSVSQSELSRTQIPSTTLSSIDYQP